MFIAVKGFYVKGLKEARKKICSKPDLIISLCVSSQSVIAKLIKCLIVITVM